jgi:hypothetical protein
VQRWHAYQGLPVHHFGGAKGSVFAFADDIDRWLVKLASDPRPADADEAEAVDEAKRRARELTERAMEMWETRSEDNLNTIAGLYRKASELDPGNTRALTGLADVIIASALLGAMDNSLAYPCARETLRRAARIDADDAGLKCCTAWLNMLHEHKWRQARAHFDEALCRHPRRSFALAGRAMLHLAEGDPVEAIKRGWEAWRQNPMVSSLGTQVCWSHYLAGDFEQALELTAQVRASGGCGAWLGEIEALALVQAGAADAFARIEALASQFPRSRTLHGVLGYVYATHKQAGRAWEILRDLEQMHAQKKSNAYALALVAVGLGLSQDAARWLEVAYAEGSVWSLGFHCDPMLRPLDGDPHFELLLRKMSMTVVGQVQSAPPLERLAHAV